MQGLFNLKASFKITKISDGLFDIDHQFAVCPTIYNVGSQGCYGVSLLRAKNFSTMTCILPSAVNTNFTMQASECKVMLDRNHGESFDSDEDDELCPVECVREFKTDDEFNEILARAKERGSLVVVDFYRTSCGSCKYIEQGFAKLCRGCGDRGAPVIFLKHNVIDEYDEQSEVAERLRIKAVPLFHFYKDGTLLEAFATRDKERISSAILKYA